MDLLKRKWIWVLLLGLVIVGLVIVNMLNMNKATIVKVTEVTEGSITEQVFTNGKLEPVKTTEVYSPVTAIVDKVNVKVGDTVKKGQVLVAFRMDEINNQIEKEQLSIELAESERLAAKKQHFEKFKEARTVDPDTEMEELDLTAYDLRIRTSQLSIESLEKKLQYSTVNAETDGVITKLSVDDGQVLQEGMKLMSISDLSSYKVNADLNELDAGKAATGMKAVITGESFEETYDGTITYLAPTADLAEPTSKEMTVDMTVTLDQATPKLRPGYNVTVEMEIPDKQRILVPIQSIKYEGEEVFVFKLDGEVVRKVPVTIGKEGEEHVEVTKGVAKGDKVVIEGIDSLSDGDQVKVE